jgi:tape measure domain-containing protein
VPPSAGSVQLEVVAKVDQALQRLAQLEAKVQGLGTSLASFTSKKIEIDVQAALASIASVTDRLRELKALAQSQGAIVLKADANQVVSEVKRAEAAVDASLAAIKAKAAADPFVDLAKVTRADFKQVSDDLDKLDKKTSETFERLKAQAAKNVFAGIGESAGKEAKLLNDEFARLQSNFQKAVDKLNTESRRVSFDPASASAQKLRENIRIAAEDIAAFAGKVKGSTDKAGGDFKKLEEAEKQAAKALQDFRKEDPIKPSFFSQMEQATSAIRGFLAVFVVREIINFAQGAVQAIESIVGAAVRLGETSAESAIKLELIETAIKGLLRGLPEVKDATKATADQLAFLRKVSDDLGINFLELATRFRSFAPAAGEAGLSLQNIDDVFRSVAVSARALGFSTDETQRALLAFQQILQKGKFQAEELTKQLGQLLPNSLAILQRETGKTREELLKMLKAGELTSDAVLALSAGLLQAFGPTSVANARTTASEIERFKNQLLEAKRAIGDELLPALRDLLADLGRIGKDGEGAFHGIGKALALLLEPLAQATRLFDSLFGDSEARSIIDRLTGVDAAFRSIVAEIDLAIIGPLATLLQIFDSVLPDAISGPLQKALEDNIQTLKDFITGLKETADQSRGAADQFKDSWSNAGKGLAKDNEDAAARLREAYKKASEKTAEDATKLTKTEAAELKKRERAFEGFFEKLQKLAEKPITPKIASPDGGTGADPFAAAKKSADEYTKKVEALQKELAGLLEEEQKLREQPVLSVEDLGRADELRDKIGGVRQALTDLGNAKPATAIATGFDEAKKAAADLAAEIQTTREKIAAALTDLVARNDAFAASFQALDKKSQDAVKAIVRQFEELNRTSKVTDADLQQFGNSLLAVFTRSGAVSAEFAARLREEFGAASASAGSASAALAALAAQSEKTSSGMDKLAGSAGEAAKGQDALAAAAKQNDNAGLKPLTDTLIRVDKATGNLVISNEKLSGGFRATDETLKQVISFLEEHHQSTITAKQAQDEFGLSLEQLAAKFRGAGADILTYKDKTNDLQETLRVLGVNTEGTGQQLATLSNKAEEAARTLDKASVEVDDLGKKEVPPATAESVAKIGKAGEDAAVGLDKTGKSAEAAKAPLDGAATAAEKLSKATIPPELADGLVTLGAAAKVAAEPLNQAAAGAEKLAAGLRGIGTVNADGVTALATAVQGLAAPLAAAAEPAAKVGAALTEISTSLTSIGGAADTVTASLNGLAETAGKIAGAGDLEKIGSQLTTVDTAAGALGKDLDLAATGLAKFNEQAEPTAATAESLKKSFEGLDLAKTVDQFNGLNAAAAKVAKALDDGGAGAERLGTALKGSIDSFGDLKKAADDLGADLRGPFKSSLAVGEAAAVSFGKAIDADAKSVLSLLGALERLRDEGIPIIKAASAAVQELNGALELTKDRADQAAEATGKIKIP